MSDLYLVLRTRLPTVGKRYEWVEIGSDVMLSARTSKGLSREAVAREMNLSAKTYERYEKRGEVPSQEVANLAAALGLVIEPSEPARVSLNGGDAGDLNQAVAELVDVARTLAEVANEFREFLQAQREDPPAPVEQL